LFLLLLAHRLDLFHTNEPIAPSLPRELAARESWMNIYQGKQKIGYAHRRLNPQEDGYSLQDSMRIRINTMGMSQDIHMATSAGLNSDLSLDTFSFQLNSSLFRFSIQGKREGDVLTLYTDGQEIHVPADDTLFLAPGMLDAVLDGDMGENESRRFMIFDPASMGQRPVRVTMRGYDRLTIMGRDHLARKMQIDAMGVSQYAWVGEDGTILQEDGLMGIRLQRTNRKDALGGRLSSSVDLTEMVSVIPKGHIDHPLTATQLRLKISGLTSAIKLQGDRQSVQGDVLVIRREAYPSAASASASPSHAHLMPTPFIQSDHPEIVDQVNQIVKVSDPDRLKAEKILNWIHTHIAKRPVLSVPDALETLKHRVGDCNEHAVLMAAMARACGIPSQIDAGLVLTRGRFYYHAWNVLYLDGWVTADALMGQLPADITHLRLVRGDAKDQIDLMGVIGNIAIEILEPEP